MAQFGMTEAELGMQEGELANVFKLQEKQIAEEKRLAKRAAIEDAVRRGIAQSSLYLQKDTEVTKAAADAISQLEGEYGTKKVGRKQEGSRARRIQSAKKTLKQQRDAAVAEAKTSSAKGKLDLESLLALIGTGISGTNFVGG